MAFSLDDLKGLIDTGTKAYGAVVGTQTEKLVEKAAVTPAAPAAIPATAQSVSALPPAQPWYKAPWVIPTAIGAALLFFGGIFAISRKR